MNRLGCKEKFPQRWPGVLPWLHGVLVRWYKSQRLDRMTFCLLHKGRVALALPSTSLDAVLARKGDKNWSIVQDELVELCEDRKGFGYLLFGDLIAAVVSARVATAVDEKLKEWLYNKIVISVTDLAAKKLELQKEILSTPGIEMVQKLKKISVRYRGLLLTGVEVRSTAEEVDLHMSALIKTIACDKEILTPLSFEGMLVGDRSTVRHAQAVQADCVQASEECRLSLNAEGEELAFSDADEYKEALRPSAARLCLTDATFKIEEALLRLVGGDQARQTWNDSIMNCLPSPMIALQPETAAQRLSRFSASAAYKFALHPWQQALVTVQKVIANIVAGESPDVQMAMKNTKTQPFIAQMQYFIRDKKLESEQMCFGTAALEVIGLRCAAAREEKKMTAEMLQPVQIYRWLWPEDCKEMYQKLVDEVALVKAAKLSKLNVANESGDKLVNKRVLDSAYSMFVSDSATGSSSSSKKQK